MRYRELSVERVSPGIVLCLLFLLGSAEPLLAQQGYEAELQRAAGNPADPEAAFALAQAAAESGDLQTAITALERVLLLYPGLANIKLELGVLYLQTGATELGETLLREALASPEMPPDVRVRAEEFLAAAEVSNNPLSVRSTVSVGLVADSNASSAPSGFGFGFDVDPEATGESDLSVYALGGVELRYDLGTQAGHALALDTFFYTQRYQEQQDLNLDRIAVGAGVDFNLSYWLGKPAELAVRVDGNLAWRDGEDYLSELGPSLTFRMAHDDRTSVEVAAFWRKQNYRPTARVSVNNERDGEIAGLSVRGDWRLTEQQSFYLGISAVSKTAVEDYEAYNQLALTTGYAHAFAAPAGLGAGPWVASINATLSRSEYDGPDPVIADIFDITGTREDDALTLTAGLQIPLDERAAMTFEIGHTKQDSTYPTDDFDNTFGSIGFSRRF